MGSLKLANVVIFNGHRYPATHWLELRRFMDGDEWDPRKIFRLADDTWDAWRYSKNAQPRERGRYRFRFSHLRSWLKPYVKRFCYNAIIGSDNFLTRSYVRLPSVLSVADRFIIENNFGWLDDLASPAVFESLWAAHLIPQHTEDKDAVLLPQAAVVRQQQSRSFWNDLCLHYGAPQIVPPVASYKQRPPAEISADKSKLIPDAVTRQLVNKLSLHRNGTRPINNYHHLRLCVLLLVICLGRRIEEVLGASRGAGSDGPLERFPCRHNDGGPADALWFRFRPNKGGASEWVYISREWEEIALYCVCQLVKYSDEVRPFASQEEQELLILISTWNWTYGPFSSKAVIPEAEKDFNLGGALGGKSELCRRHIKRHTTGITYSAFTTWLNGRNHKDSRKSSIGIMKKWNITSDGSMNDLIYHFRTHDARHTRQSALAFYPEIPLLARQRDLNHRDTNMQFAYQHVLDEQNEALMVKITEAPLLGQGCSWLNDLLALDHVDTKIKDKSNDGFKPVKLFTPRWRNLIENHASYIEPNEIEYGFCDSAEGPDGCIEYKKARTLRANKMNEMDPTHKNKTLP